MATKKAKKQAAAAKIKIQYYRSTIAFPKTQGMQDLMLDAPSEVEPKQLEELHIQVVPPKKPVS